MVKILLIYLSFLFFLVEGHAAELKVKTDKAEVEMGKYLTVSIIYVGDSTPQSTNLYQWQKEFVIERRDNEVESLLSGQLQYTETLRLYPREMGNKVLHSIALAGAISLPVNILVKPALRNNVNGTPQWLPLPKTMWQGETIEVTIRLNLFDFSNHIAVDEALFPGFEVKQLTRKIITTKKNKSVLIRWQLTAQTMGVYQLEPPVIEQRGRGRWRFYLNRKTIKVKPLPSYLPVTIPVGKVSIETKLDQSRDVPVWQLIIKNRGQFPSEIYSIRTQLSKISNIAVESVQLEKSSANKNSLIHTQIYHTPVPDWSWGFGKGPNISVHYFDSDEGRLKILKDNFSGVWQLPDNFYYLLLLLLTLVVIVLLKVLVRAIKKVRIWQNYRKSIKQVNDTHQLRHLLLKQADSRTLKAWAIKQNDQVAFQIAKQLNQLCYANSSNFSLSKIKRSLLGHQRFFNNK
jgi:hypothetical protein